MVKANKKTIIKEKIIDFELNKLKCKVIAFHSEGMSIPDIAKKLHITMT